MNTQIRPQVVGLLLVLDMPACNWPAGHPVRMDGTPFSAAEAELVAGATWPELRAARDLMQSEAEAAQEKATDYGRLADLMRPYLDRLGPGATLQDAMAVMPPAERTEVAELVERLG